MTAADMSVAQFNAIVDAQMTEAMFQGWAMGAARQLGWLAYHTWDSRKSPEGFPDLVMVRGDRLVFAELKRQRVKKLRPGQEIWGDALFRFATNVSKGVQYFVWRPSDRDSILEVLR